MSAAAPIAGTRRDPRAGLTARTRKARTWRPLHAAWHLNAHSDFYYRLLYGDKETFHLGWRLTGTEYGMPARAPERLLGLTICQHDFAGRRLFQHRNFAKWQLHGPNPRIFGFRHESQCLADLEELRQQWPWTPPGIRRWQPAGKSHAELAAAHTLCAGTWVYHRQGHDHRPIAFAPTGLITEGTALHEIQWDIRQSGESILLEIFSATDKTLTASLQEDGSWSGAWISHLKTPVAIMIQSFSTYTPTNEHRR